MRPVSVTERLVDLAIMAGGSLAVVPLVWALDRQERRSPRHARRACERRPQARRAAQDQCHHV